MAEEIGSSRINVETNGERFPLPQGEGYGEGRSALKAPSPRSLSP